MDNDNTLKDIIIEDVSPVTKRINLKLDEEKTKYIFNGKLVEASKKSNIKGFRPGKAPLSVIEKHYGLELYGDAVVEALNEEFKKIVSEHDLQVVGEPKLENKQGGDSINLAGSGDALAPSEGGEYFITFEVMPTVKDLNLDIKVKKIDKRDITSDVIEEEINFLLERLAEPEELKESEAINENDRYFVKIDYITIDEETGKEVDSAKDYSISINSSIIDKSFEASFIGKKKGDGFEFNDKERNVTVKGFIKEIDKKILPELNTETIKNFGDFKDVEEFKKYVEKNLDRYEEKRHTDALRSEISEGIVNLNPTELPESVVEESAKARLEDLKRQDKYKNLSDKQSEEMISMLKIMAKRDILLYLLLSETAKMENIALSETDFEGFYKKTALESNMKEEEVKGFYAAKEAQENLGQALLDDKIFDFLIQNKISYIEE